MSRKFQFSIGEKYHIYGRGNDKRTIFLDNRDYVRFIALLYVCNNTETIHLSDHQNSTLAELLEIERELELVDIGAYCLMPNHFHLLIHEKIINGISKFMQKVLTAYTMYFNKKYEKAGSLFSSRFRANHIDNDNYLKYLFSYIHLNPIKIIDPKWKENGISNKQKAKIFLDSYNYSSFPDYSGEQRKERVILNTGVFPGYFNNFKEFEDFINDWLNYGVVKVQP